MLRSGFVVVAWIVTIAVALPYDAPPGNFTVFGRDPPSPECLAIASRLSGRPLSMGTTFLTTGASAWGCLSSIKIPNLDDAKLLLENVKKIVAFQPNLDYLSLALDSDKVDLLAEIDELSRRLDATDGSGFQGQYDFEISLSKLLVQARDPRLKFHGYLSRGIARFYRTNLNLVSLSEDSIKPPKLYHHVDASANKFYPIATINGQEASAFIDAEAAIRLPYRDRDARYNTMTFLPNPHIPIGKQMSGLAAPFEYPGPITTLTFEDEPKDRPTIDIATETLLRTHQEELQRWEAIGQGADFAQTFLDPSGDAAGDLRSLARTSMQELNRGPYLPSIGLFDTRTMRHARPTPQGWVDAVQRQVLSISLPGPLVGMPGYEDLDPYGVAYRLASGQLFRSPETYQGASLILDLRGFQTAPTGAMHRIFSSLFPLSTNAGGPMRFRRHAAMELLGGHYSLYELPAYDKGHSFGTSYLNQQTLLPFQNWAQLYRPSGVESEFYIVTPDTPFMPTTGPRPEDIVLFSDGSCGGDCALFVEWILNEPGGDKVKRITVGGSPQPGPSALVVGKTHRSFNGQSLIALSEGISSSDWAFSPADNKAAKQVLPSRLPIRITSLTTAVSHIVRNIRGQYAPAEFVQDFSHCRFYYEARTLYSPSTLMYRVALSAWGGPDGSVPSTLCIPGSYTAPPKY